MYYKVPRVHEVSAVSEIQRERFRIGAHRNFRP